MSLFTCKHCSIFLKKKNVENHFEKNCQNGVSLACNGCKEDFDKFTYRKHVCCMPKGQTHGHLKTQVRFDVMKKLKERKDLSEEQANLVTLLLAHIYIPKKKNKYQNFIKHNIYKDKDATSINMEVADQVWNLLQEGLGYCNETQKTLKMNKNKEGDKKVASKKLGKAQMKMKQKAEKLSVESMVRKKKKQMQNLKKNASSESQLENGNLGKRKQSGNQQLKKGMKQRVQGKGASISEERVNLGKRNQPGDQQLKKKEKKRRVEGKEGRRKEGGGVDQSVKKRVI